MGMTNMEDKISESELLGLIRHLNVSEDSNIPYKNNAPFESSKHKIGARIRVHNNEVIYEGGHSSKEAKFKIDFAPPIKLFVNDKEMTSGTQITREDHVTWQIVDPLYEIKVIPSGMKAYLNIIKHNRHEWELINTEPSTHLVMSAIEKQNCIVESLAISGIMGELKDRGIVRGVNIAQLIKAASQSSPVQMVIAEGIEPTAGQDASLELLFSESIMNVFQEVEGYVDFKSHKHIPQSSPGDILARFTPMKRGVHGYNIYNEIVMSPLPKDIRINPGAHVELNNKGEFIALKAGRPKLSGVSSKRIDITTEYVIHHDVNLESGNIFFNGDVIIYGNVLESMIVESLGNVYVFGNVYRATITATGSIFVSGNVTGGYLYSGYFGVIYNRLYTLTKQLAGHFNQLIESASLMINIIHDQGKYVEVGHLLRLLLETKTPDLLNTIQFTMNALQEVRNTDQIEWSKLRNQLELVSNRQDYVNLDDLNTLEELERLLIETYSTIEQMQDNKVTIEFSQCNGAVIKSNGDIMVSKEGTIQSQLFAKERIIYKHEDSVCRGGEIEAGGIIWLKAVGGVSGGEAIIKSNSKMHANKIYMAKICIGKWTRHVQEPLQNVKAYLEKGKLVIEGIPL
jgi:hypothetical protein